MNRWARRHLDALVEELDEGEELLAAGRVMINSVAAVPALPSHGQSTAAPPSPDRGLGTMLSTARLDRIQRRAARGRGSARSKLRAAQHAGFPAPGPVMVLGVTNRRLVIWRPTAVLARPGGIIADYPLDRIGSMRLLRRFGFQRLDLALPSGTVVVLQNLWCNALPALAAAYDEVKSARSRARRKFPAS